MGRVVLCRELALVKKARVPIFRIASMRRYRKGNRFKRVFFTPFY